MSQEYTTFNLIKKGFWSKTGKCCGEGESAGDYFEISQPPEWSVFLQY